tara:strand:+ start:2486 stop:3370 length:885 start_codon:yes stop_codon:yes gene_type:complete
MDKVIPDFFIVGAPKCGTTSLSMYLSDHPGIIMSNPKEPHYFSTDIENGRIANFNEYLACFSHIDPTLVFGEASTLYLYSKTAAENILAHNKDALFIVMLRNPVDIVFSFHQVALKFFGETITNLGTAWDLQIERINGKQIPRGCPDPKLLFYGEIAKLGAQVKRLISSMNPEQIKFIFFEEFVNETNKVYNSILEFLKVKQNHMPDFAIHNPTRRIKFSNITKTVNQIVGLKKAVGIKKQFGFAKRIHSSNVGDSPPNHMNQSLKTSLSNYFKEDIQLLSSLMKKDLSDWVAK